MEKTIYNLLADQAKKNSGLPVILAPDRLPLTYQQLLDQINVVASTLNNLGIGRNDRVAIVLPNGPEMAVSFLSISCTATSAPLNPLYQSAEFDFYLTDLKAKALIVMKGDRSPAIGVAESKNIPIIELSVPDSARAGEFKLSGKKQPLNGIGGYAQPDDIALVLHTSGTTSRPKIVPLTQMNLCTSAGNIAQTLHLTSQDRCLNIMPLFHIHGLMAALLASIVSGASVVCATGFLAPKFFEWMTTNQPTWYSAVPTMHQSILSRAVENKPIIEQTKFRFIRSSSSSLAPQVMADLEAMFNAPVIEAYGMTEASHQMASNPLPPLPRKPGSVGVAAGPEVEIMDVNTDMILNRGETGEIVIQGANVTRGYENNPEANAKALSNGWFRTGDQGYLDEEGYLYITGRLKEIINRGGEKIMPREVDEVLLSHPAVAQVVTFAMPDRLLGEEVAAAVILKDPSVSELTLRQYVAERLSSFKVPKRILILDEIPKGPTGKLQRIGLAEKLGLKMDDEIPRSKEAAKRLVSAPRNHVEEILLEIWREVLNIPTVSIDDNFVEVGGDSILAMQLIFQVQERLDKSITIVDFLGASTIADQSAVIIEKLLLQSKGDRSGAAQEEDVKEKGTLIRAREVGSKPPFFLISPTREDTFKIQNLSTYLDKDQPFYGLVPSEYYAWHREPEDIARLASIYIKEILSVQTEGPYYIGGNCYGGDVALEVSRQLQLSGHKVALLVLFESHGGAYPYRATGTLKIFYLLAKVYRYLELHFSNLKYVPWNGKMNYIRGIRRDFIARNKHLIAANREEKKAKDQPMVAVRNLYDGHILVFRASKQPLGIVPDPTLGWGPLVSGKLDIVEVPGHHYSILFGLRAKRVAEILGKVLADARATF